MMSTGKTAGYRFEKQSKNNQMARGGRRIGAGRKPGISDAMLLRRKIQDHFSDDEMDQLVLALKEEVIKNHRPDLMKFVLEQLFGKASQRVELTGENSRPFVITIAKEIAEQNGLI
jgi:hypothetical protein